MKKLFCLFSLIFSVSLLSAVFEAGEKLHFKISYGFITAGKATLKIEEHLHADSIPAFQISSEAKTNSFFNNFYKVRDEITSIWDKRSLVTRRFTKKLREGSYRQHRIHYYYPEQNLTIYLKKDKKAKKWTEKKMDIPENTQDILSAFYWIRKQDFSVGDSIRINVTVDGRSKVAQVIVHRIEMIDTIFGKKECFVIEPVLVGDTLFKQTGRIFVWLTKDEYKIPIMLESKIIFGHFRAILENAEKVPYQKK